MPSQVSLEVYDGLTTWARADTSGELLDYVDAMMAQLQPIVDLVRDSDTHPGWARLLDVDVAPSEALPWLAQFVGVTPLLGLSDDAQRLRIKEAAGWQRGTPSAIRAAAGQYLTGQRLVELYERDGGNPWQLRVRTYRAETPDSQKVYDALLALKPAGLVLVYEVQEGLEIDALVGTIDGMGTTIDAYADIVPGGEQPVSNKTPYGRGAYGAGNYGGV